MEPNKKIVNGAQEPVTETDSDQEIENQNISQAIVSAEPHMPDITGLNNDIAFVNRSPSIELPEQP